MATVTIPNTFVTGGTITAAAHNGNNSAITDQVNGNLDSTNLANLAVTNAKLAGSIAMAKIDSDVCMFQAFLAAKQEVGTSPEKIDLGGEEYDITGVYDEVTNYRFTPTTGGYYLINWSVQAVGSAAGDKMWAGPYKNAALFCATYHDVAGAGDEHPLSGSVIISLNGSGDYVELWGGSTTTLYTAGGAAADPKKTWMSGHLIATN